MTTSGPQCDAPTREAGMTSREVCETSVDAGACGVPNVLLEQWLHDAGIRAYVFQTGRVALRDNEQGTVAARIRQYMDTGSLYAGEGMDVWGWSDGERGQDGSTASHHLVDGSGGSLAA